MRVDAVLVGMLRCLQGMNGLLAVYLDEYSEREDENHGF
jgi:hypothetical protein